MERGKDNQSRKHSGAFLTTAVIREACGQMPFRLLQLPNSHFVSVRPLEDKAEIIDFEGGLMRTTTVREVTTPDGTIYIQAKETSLGLGSHQGDNRVFLIPIGFLINHPSPSEFQSDPKREAFFAEIDYLQQVQTALGAITCS